MILSSTVIFFVTLLTVVVPICHVDGEVVRESGDDSMDAVGAESTSSSEEEEDNLPMWVQSLHDKMSQIASVWSSRVFVTIIIIVMYDLFSPERRRRRRKELEQRQLQREHEEQLLKEQEEKEQGEQSHENNGNGKVEATLPFHGTAHKLGKDTSDDHSSALGIDQIMESNGSQQKNRLLDRLEQEHKNNPSNDEGRKTDELNTKEDSSINNKKTEGQKGSKQSQQQRPLVQHVKPSPPRMKASSGAHPGMKEFSYWYDVQTSLFRIYTITRKDGQEVVPPYVPHSHRGNVKIYLDVKNTTSHTIKVFWVDYKGHHILKGTMAPYHTWTQTTFIDHPWVFETEEGPCLYYVPYRAIPTLPTAPTLSPDGDIGQHKFSLVPSKPNDDFTIGIEDEILPHPGIVHFHTPLLGINWTLTHMSRTMDPDDPSVDTLQRYLTNILDDPSSVKYRQIRIASKNFAPIWQSPMRGLLHAVGFVEVGAYAELGSHDYPLSRGRVQEVALLSYLLSQWRTKPTAGSQSQPNGAIDGFGRAGFGRAGSAN